MSNRSKVNGEASQISSELENNPLYVLGMSEPSTCVYEIKMAKRCNSKLQVEVESEPEPEPEAEPVADPEVDGESASELLPLPDSNNGLPGERILGQTEPEPETEAEPTLPAEPFIAIADMTSTEGSGDSQDDTEGSGDFISEPQPQPMVVVDKSARNWPPRCEPCNETGFTTDGIDCNVVQECVAYGKIIFLMIRKNAHLVVRHTTSAPKFDPCP